jgi:F420-dependent oxidoreductase-like protein
MVGFGVQIWPEYSKYQDLKQACQECENLGFSSVWLYDHLYPMGDHPPLEGWTALAALAADTKTIRLGVLVSCNLFRPPPLLAKMATTVDVISNGRLEFALGAGWYEKEFTDFGIPYMAFKERIERLEEAIQLIQAMWVQDKPSFIGKYYTLNQSFPEVKPLQKPYPPIWIGGNSRAVLRVAAKYADYCNFAHISTDDLHENIEFFNRECAKAGRDHMSVLKTWHGQIILSDDTKEVERRALFLKSKNETDKNLSLKAYLDKIIAGDVDQCSDKIQQLIDEEITYFIPANPTPDELQIIGKQIITQF